MMSENKELKITSANYDAAFAMADEPMRKVLATLVGKADEETATNTPTLSDYTTIRSYEDACAALGERVDEDTLKSAGVPAHIIALMKLELICKALWGGENKCQPTADGSKIWWYPVMALWTPSELAGMDKSERTALLSASANPGATAGFGCLGAVRRSSWAGASGGFRLCLDTEEKATYFGKQFVKLWAEYLAYNFTVGEHITE